MNYTTGKLSSGDTVPVRSSAGGAAVDGVVQVANGALVDIRIPSTGTMLANGDTVVVKNSAGTTVTGTHTAEVSAGVLADVKLASTVAGVVSGVDIVVPVTGVYATKITPTVVAGVITAIVLS